MKLQTLLRGLEILQLHADDQLEIAGVQYDSRQVTAGDLFVAVSGFQTDGHKYIEKTVQSGAVCTVCERKPETDIPYVLVPDARAALAVLGRVDGGIVITKYGHVRGPLPGVTCCEAGHPVPDDNSFAATQRALALVSGLRADDTVLFLLSGGGSALFEKPLLPAEELQAVTQALLACGADIVEINTIRKRLSAVKGGRFALACAPAAVYSVVLSDILGDPLDMIASGPLTWPYFVMTIPPSTQPSTATAAWAICHAALPAATRNTRPCG